MENKISKRAQVTIFVIIAIVVLALVGGYFVIRNVISVENKLPADFQPVYQTILQCLEDETQTGINVLESSGGYIETPRFESGSSYLPFSSQLNFLGNPIPYWYYVSGNNIQKEQVPTLSNMQNDLENFIEDRIPNCDLLAYYGQGFEINFEKAKAVVKISSSKVDVSLEMPTNLLKENTSVSVSNFKTLVNSDLGKLYEDAKTVYTYEQQSLFLESYAVDFLRNYAPVDGVELSCSPLVWSAEKVFENLSNGIVANMQMVRSKDGATISKPENKYFLRDFGVDSDVRFLASKNWPYSFEVNPSQGAMMISKPVGNSPGLGALGFCYVPYHYVYDVKYPVLVQISSEKETFQFPLAVVVEGNQPRKALEFITSEYDVPNFCEDANTNIDVATYDSNLDPVEAEISFRCFGVSCNIGKTSLTKYFTGVFPQCANGVVTAEASGFATKEEVLSSVQEGTIDLILDRLTELDVQLNLDGKEYLGNALISFISDFNSQTTVYPEMKKVNLSEGQYQVEVYIYKNSSISIPATSQEQCVEVPKEGVGSLLGLTEEKCFNIEIPSQIISNALSGGGKQEHYILEEDLTGSSVVKINAQSLPLPKDLNQLQDNYVLFEKRGLDIEII